MHSWGKIMDSKIQKKKKPKIPNCHCHFRRARSKIRVLHMPPAHTTTKGVGKTPKPPLQPNLGTHPYPHLI